MVGICCEWVTDCIFTWLCPFHIVRAWSICWIQFHIYSESSLGITVYVHWKLAILQLNMPILWECLHTMIKVTTNEHLCMPMNEAYVFFYHKNCNFTHTVGFWATNNTQYGTTDHAWVVLEWSRHSLMSYITTSSNMPIPVLAAK